MRRHPQWTAALSIFVFAAFTLFVFNEAYRGRVTRRLDAIRAKGQPLTLEDLNARSRSVPDEENMTPAIIAAMRPLAMTPAGVPRTVEVPNELLFLGTELAPNLTEAIDPKVLAANRTFLDVNKVMLDQLDQAIARKAGAYEIHWSSPATNVTFAGLSEIRAAFKVQSLRIFVEVEAGYCDAALAHLQLMDRSLHCLDGEYEPVVLELVRMACVAITENVMQRVLNRCELSAEALAEMRGQLATTHRPGALVTAIEVERVFLLDTIRCMDSGTLPVGSLIGGGSGASMIRRLPILPHLDTSVAMDHYLLLLEVADTPIDRQMALIPSIEAADSNIPEYAVISRLLGGSLTRFFVMHIIRAANARTMEAAIACEQYRLTHGHWPATLDDAVPEFLDAVPIDPFDRKPLRYEVMAKGIKVWSVGEDEMNDGGDLQWEERAENRKKPKDQGTVILNPELRRGAAQP